MPKQIEISNARLAFTKEAVANLSEQDLEQMAGGHAESPSSSGVGTCVWCPSPPIIIENYPDPV